VIVHTIFVGEGPGCLNIWSRVIGLGGSIGRRSRCGDIGSRCGNVRSRGRGVRSRSRSVRSGNWSVRSWGGGVGSWGIGSPEVRPVSQGSTHENTSGNKNFQHFEKNDFHSL